MPADLIAKIRQYPKTAAFVLGSLSVLALPPHFWLPVLLVSFTGLLLLLRPVLDRQRPADRCPNVWVALSARFPGFRRFLRPVCRLSGLAGLILQKYLCQISGLCFALGRL